MIFCSCLNVSLNCEPAGASEEDVLRLQAVFQPPSQAQRLLALHAQYACLTSEVTLDNDVTALKCLNCSTAVFARVAGSSPPCTAVTNSALLSAQQAEVVAASREFSSEFRVVISSTSTAAEPTTPLSPAAYFSADTSSPANELFVKLQDVSRAERIRIEKEIAALRKQLADFSARVNAEAQALATKAGYQRNSFGEATPTASPRRTPTSPAFSRHTSGNASTLPSDLDPASNMDLAASLQIRSSFVPSSILSTRRASLSAPSGDPELSNNRKVKFAELESPAEPSSPSSSLERHESAVFDFDEELSFRAASSLDSTAELEIDGVSLVTQPVNVGPSRSAGDDVLSPRSLNPIMSTENKEQIRKLRDLLGSDMPSHRDQFLKPAPRGMRNRPLQEDSEHEDDVADTHPALLATSMPVRMNYTRKTHAVPLEQKTSVPDGEGIMVPPLPRPKPRSSASEREIKQQLFDATQRAASASFVDGRPFPRSLPQLQHRRTDSSSSSDSSMAGAKPQPVPVNKDYFAPPSSRTASFGPSSLTAALAANPAKTKLPPSDNLSEGQPLQVGLGKSDEQEFDGDEPDFFLPPHLWVRMSRAGDGLLSTSIHDVNM